MRADPDSRKSPCANTGRDSVRNLNPILPSNPALSNALINPALLRRCWDEEDRRLEKLWQNTGREIHRIALENHRAAVEEKTRRLCE
jgi:hypothetical protein